MMELYFNDIVILRAINYHKRIRRTQLIQNNYMEINSLHRAIHRLLDNRFIYGIELKGKGSPIEYRLSKAGQVIVEALNKAQKIVEKEIENEND